MTYRTGLFVLLFLCSYFYQAVTYGAINIIAAESFYGSVAKELGGPYVDVTSILTDSAQNPHSFTLHSLPDKTTIADIIIYNGAGYDTWIKPVLASKSQKKRSVIVIADLIHAKSNDDPHLWYKLETTTLYAENLAAILSERDPAHQAYYEEQLERFLSDYQIVIAMVKRLKRKYHNTSVIATESIFNAMLDALGLQMHGEDLQKNVMNNLPSTVEQINQFAEVIKQHTARLFIYNTQVVNTVTQQMLSLAQQEKIPIMMVNETMPANTTYIKWILDQLVDLEIALNHRKGIANKMQKSSKYQLALH